MAKTDPVRWITVRGKRVPLSPKGAKQALNLISEPLTCEKPSATATVDWFERKIRQALGREREHSQTAQRLRTLGDHQLADYHRDMAVLSAQEVTGLRREAKKRGVTLRAGHVEPRTK